MIYEMLLQGVIDLQTRWTDLSDGLQTLLDAVPTSDPQRSAIPPMISNANVALSAVSPPTAVATKSMLLAGRGSSITSLIDSTQNMFNASFTQFNGINTVANLPGLLPTWLVSNDGQVRAAATIVQAQLDELGHLIQNGLQELAEITTQVGAQANLSNIRGSIGDLATYPLLTRDYGYGPAPSNGNGAGTSSTSSLSQTVQKALSDVLGRRPRLGDTRSFVAALNQSFTCKEIEGHTVCTWLERSYGGLTDLGGTITGAQASLHKRGREAFDSAVPMLEVLNPLLTDADPQEFEAARSIVRTEFTELINELGVEGGPRVRRVDNLFELLIGLGIANAAVRPFAVQPRRNRSGLIYDKGNADLFHAVGGGEVGHFGDVGGFERDFVNTIAEEQILTNFIILRDYLKSLFDSWQTFRTAFLGGTDNFLGTQLVLLQRTLAVIAEQVDEIAFAMDSVFLGPAERQTVRIDFPTAVAPPMFVEELLSWVKSFASEEGPNIIQESGKHGVRSIVPTLQQLHDLVANIDGRIRHPGARHPRVQRTMDELVTQLADATRLAGTIR